MNEYRVQIRYPQGGTGLITIGAPSSKIAQRIAVELTPDAKVIGVLRLDPWDLENRPGGRTEPERGRIYPAGVPRRSVLADAASKAVAEREAELRTITLTEAERDKRYREWMDRERARKNAEVKASRPMVRKYRRWDDPTSTPDSPKTTQWGTLGRMPDWVREVWLDPSVRENQPDITGPITLETLKRCRPVTL